MFAESSDGCKGTSLFHKKSMREHLPGIVFQLHAAVGEAVSFPYSRTEHGKQKNRRVVILRTKQDLECRWQPWPAVMVIPE